MNLSNIHIQKSFLGNLDNGKRFYLTSARQVKLFKLTILLFPVGLISIAFLFTIGVKLEFSNLVLFLSASLLAIVPSVIACKTLYQASLKGETLILKNCFSNKSCVTSINSVKRFKERNLLFFNVTIIKYYLDGTQRSTVVIGRKRGYLSIGQLITEAKEWSREKKKANHKPGSVVA